MKKLFIMSIITSFCSISLASDLVDIDQSVREVAPGVHAGQCIAESKEIVYLGHERIDSLNKKYWQRYSAHVDFMTKRERGIMPALSKLCKLEDRPSHDETRNATGFEKEEYMTYMDTLFSKGFYEPTKVAGLNGVGGGVAGFSIFDNGQSYVIYASKTPIQGKFPFSETPENITLKEFNTAYHDLVISVGSTVYPTGPVYENRGIFRNPQSFIEGGYKNLSTSLHAFSAVVTERIFKDKIYALVSPIPSMQGILNKSLKPGALFIGYNQKAPYENYPPILHVSPTDGKTRIAREGVNTTEYKGKDLPEELIQYTATPGGGVVATGKGLNENINLIKIDALAALYYSCHN